MGYVNFLAKEDDLDVGSDDRNMNFMLSHFGFLLFNVMNVAYLLLIEGYALGKLQTNVLSKIALVGCACQVLSCITSIHRFNINDEYGRPIGIESAFFGLLAYFFMNSAVTHLYLHGFSNRLTLWKIGTVAWFALSLFAFVMGRNNWDDSDQPFRYFRYIVASSKIFWAGGVGYTSYSLKKGTINIDPSSIMSTDSMVKVFNVLTCGTALSFAMMTFLGPIFTYPPTGLCYTCIVIAMKFGGEMDFMKASNGARPIQQGEGASLLP